MYVVGGVCLAAAVLSVAGCEGSTTSKKEALTDQEIKRLTLAQKPDRPDRLIVRGETITWEDVLASMPEESTTTPPLKETLEKAAKEMSQRRFMEEERLLVHQRLNNRISNVVLSKRARTELGNKADEKLNEYTDREVRRFILEEHGGNGAEADEALQKVGMNRVSYSQWKKKEILAHYLVDSKYPRNRPITYGEMLARYEEIKDQQFVQEGVLQLRVIDIDTAKVRRTDANDDSSRAARQLADDLRKKIDSGADFAELARKYSHDSRADEGGLWRPRNPESMAAPYDVLARAAQEVPQGQVAGPIESGSHFFVIKVEGKQAQGYRPLNEVQEEVRKDIAEQRWRETLAELDAEIARQAALADTDRFVNYCLERFYQQVHEQPPAP